MRLSSVFSFGFALSAAAAYSPALDPFLVSSYDDIYGEFSDLLLSHFAKRDSASLIEGLLTTLNLSGLIFTLLDQLAADNATINLAAQLVGGILSGNSSAGSLLSGLNITFNASSVLEGVQSSGLMTSTLQGLLLNEDNRNQLADFAGLFIAKNTFVPQLLVDLGNGVPLTIEHIIHLVKTVRSKAGNAQQDDIRNVVIDAHDKRDDNQYKGTANAFFSNALGALVNSPLLTSSAGSIFQALNNTGILVPIIIQATKDPNTLKLAQTFAVDLYNTGALTDENLPLNKYFQALKKDNTLSEGVQTLLTHPVYSPPVAAIFKRMEDSGVYQQIQRNLFGDKPGATYKSPF